MTYKEWEKTFLTGDDKSGLHEIPSDDTIKVEEVKVEEVQTPEPIVEPIEYKEPVHADYLTEVFGITGAYSKRDVPSGLTNSFVKVANPHVVKTEIPRITEELQAHIGECITEKSFVSTSVIATKNIMKDKAVLFRIQAKKGTHCYLPVNRKESECIFADNSKLYIRDVQWDDQSRKWIITAEIE